MNRSVKISPDGESPFTGKRTLLMEFDEILQDIKIMDPEVGWFTSAKTQCDFETYDKAIAPTDEDKKRNVYDPRTGLIWYPDIQVFFVKDQPILLTVDYDNLDKPENALWYVCNGIPDKESDTYYHPDLENQILEGTYIDCLNKCYQLINNAANE